MIRRLITTTVLFFGAISIAVAGNSTRNPVRATPLIDSETDRPTDVRNGGFFPGLDSPSSLTWVVVDSSRNALGGALNSITPISYDPGTDILALIHRGDQSYAVSSGQLWYNISRDAGLTWRRAGELNGVAPTDCRYPSGAISNRNGSADSTQTLFVYSAPNLQNAGAYGQITFGRDYPIGSGSGVGQVDAGTNNYTTSTTIWAQPQSAWIQWCTNTTATSPGHQNWRTSDYVTTVRSAPSSWAGQPNFIASVGHLSGVATNSASYYAVSGIFSPDSEANAVNAGYSRSFDNGATWSPWIRPQPDWMAATGLSPRYDLYDYDQPAGGTVLFNQDFTVDANERVHFFHVIVDTPWTSSAPRGIIEIYETGAGWASKWITDGLSLNPHTNLGYPGPSNPGQPYVQQTGNSIHVSISRDRRVMTMVWLDAPSSSPGDTLPDIWFSWRRIESANWSTPTNLTQTPGFAELLLHAAQTLRTNTSGSYTLFLGRTYQSGINTYPPDYNLPSTLFIAPYTFVPSGVLEGATTLTVRDGGGTQDTLSYGTGFGATDGVDLEFGEQELPQIPPVGTFDVRWQIPGTHGSKRDIRDTLGVMHRQAVHTGLIQAGPGGYPITLQWNRTQLPGGTLLLRDTSGGTRFSVNLRQCDSLVITDPTLISFQLIHNWLPIQKLFVRDNGGLIDSLGFGTMAGATDGVDFQLGEFELLPAPPTGVFDVRWTIAGTSGTNVDIRDTLGGNQTRVVYRGRVQPGPGGNPFVLKWNHTYFPASQYILRDEIQGSRFSVDMNLADSLVVSDPGIQSFQIIYDLRPTQRVFVRDNGGVLDSLDFGVVAGATDGIDARFGESELFPIPSSGIFDVRWQIGGTNGAKLDMRDTLGGTRTRTTYRALAQPGSGGYPISLSWNRYQFPAGTFSLRDAPEGTRFLIDMKQQDSLLLSSSDIGSFQIIYDKRLAVQCIFRAGWNLMSLPLRTNDQRKSWLFPMATSNAFSYVFPSGYQARDTFTTGVGYWLKFPSEQGVTVAGELVASDTISLNVGWNMIGSISDSVPVTSIQQIPPTIIASPFFGYTTGYSVSTTLQPSKGYWIRSIAPGHLILSRSPAANRQAKFPYDAIGRAARIEISDSKAENQTLLFSAENFEPDELDFFQLPPLPPEGVFDARFLTGRMLETVGTGETRTIPIQLTSEEYPLLIRWDMNGLSVSASLLVGTSTLDMSSAGSVTIEDPRTALSLMVGAQPTLPKEFALFQNFPNPFNPVTTLSYDLPRDSRVILKLFNLLGEEMITLVNEDQKGGHKSIIWDASDFASGVYFYRIQASDFVSVRKMLLLK
jgi:hypothetical protein